MTNNKLIIALILALAVIFALSMFMLRRTTALPAEIDSPASAPTEQTQPKSTPIIEQSEVHPTEAQTSPVIAAAATPTEQTREVSSYATPQDRAGLEDAAATPTPHPFTLPTRKLPQSTPTPTIEIERTTLATATPLPAAAGQTQPKPATPGNLSTATIREETLTLPTYNYEQALSVSPDFPYPLLDEDQVGPVRPKPYQAIILENDSLRLTFLPALGGRLYQITGKASGEDLLYNNPVVKPTHWGPPEMTWWLIVGGMEWAFPVEEHGYAWAMPWSMTTEIDDEGAAIARLYFLDPVTNLATDVTVTLPAEGASFDIAMNLSNTGSEPAEGQLWINTALSAGPNMRVEMPVSTVEIHSVGPGDSPVVGDIVPWEAEMGTWGPWRQWFSVFAAEITGNTHVLRGHTGNLALRRDFTPEMTPGLKLFTWGVDFNTAEYEGRPYYEVWSGLTSNFETNLTLNPGQSQGWVETWTVVNDE